MYAEIRSDVKALKESTRIYIENFNQRLDDSIRTFNNSVESLNRRLNWFFVATWGIFGLVGAVIAGVQLYLAFRQKP